MTNQAAARVDALLRCAALVEPHPGGLRLERVAELVGIDPGLLHQTLVDLDSLDLPPDVANVVPRLRTLRRWSSVEAAGDSGGVDEDWLQELPWTHAGVVVDVVVDTDAHLRLGVAWASATDLGRLLRAAMDLHDLEPDNRDLAEAIDILTGTLMLRLARQERLGLDAARQVAQALQAGVCVHLTYAPPRGAGIEILKAHPHAVITTPRGFAVAVGIGDEGSGVRILDARRVLSAEISDEPRAKPVDVEEVVAAAARTTSASVSAAVSDRWIIEAFTEGAAIAQADAFDATYEVQIAQPVPEVLVDLLMLTTSRAFVIGPHDVAARSSRDLERRARELLAHHEL